MSKGAPACARLETPTEASFETRLRALLGTRSSLLSKETLKDRRLDASEVGRPALTRPLEVDGKSPAMPPASITTIRSAERHGLRDVVRDQDRGEAPARGPPAQPDAASRCASAHRARQAARRARASAARSRARAQARPVASGRRTELTAIHRCGRAGQPSPARRATEFKACGLSAAARGRSRHSRRSAPKA